ncbi:MAG TPA: ABC transporter permease subunit [Clostridia bacterium]|nr:ABC transporter permease subunit [Clostridia bacterium]
MKTIFLKEFKDNKKSFMIWLISVVIYNIFVMSAYPTVAKQASQLDVLLKNYPTAMIKAFNLDKLRLSNVLDYFGIESYLIITLVGSMFAMIFASTILSKEEKERSIEFLLSKPVKRSEIVTAKLLCVLIYVFLFDLIFAMVNYVSMHVVKQGNFDIKVFLLLSVGPFLMHLTFASIGFMISVILPKVKSMVSFSIGIIFTMYFLELISDLTDKLKDLRYFTPFKYVDAAELIFNKRIETVYLSIMFTVILLSIGVSYLIYQKRDILI